MCHKIMEKENFYILKSGKGFIVVNGNKKFKEGHTHLRSYKSAIACVDFVLKNKIPKRCDFYYLTSLQRVATNEKYIEKIEQLKEVRKQKGKKLPYVKKFNKFN